MFIISRVKIPSLDMHVKRKRTGLLNRVDDEAPEKVIHALNLRRKEGAK